MVGRQVLETLVDGRGTVRVLFPRTIVGSLEMQGQAQEPEHVIARQRRPFDAPLLADLTCCEIAIAFSTLVRWTRPGLWMSRFAPFWLQAIVLLVAGIAVALWLGGVRQHDEIRPANMQPGAGLAFVVGVAPPAWPFVSTPDSDDHAFQSRLNVYEDGTRLGPQHVQHARIAERGGGAYSHWQQSLIFSTSDNSDPRSNGRAYTTSERVHLSRIIGIPATILVLAVLPGILWRLWPHARRLYQRCGLQRIVNSLLAWPRGRLVVRASVLLISVVAIALWLGGIQRDTRIDPKNIQPESGRAFVVELPQPRWPFVASPDEPEAPLRSDLKAFEDGAELGPEHALHATVREAGGGSYSHWHGALLFSTSDNSDPRSNGRRYTTSERIHLPWMIGISALLIVLAFFRVAARALHQSPRLTAFYRRSGLQWTEQRLRPWRYWIISAAVAAATVAIPLLIILHNWLNASTVAGAVAGFYQVSDSAGYVQCANSLIDLGAFSLDWCDRRPIYSSLLAALLMISDRDFHIMLLLQGALVGAVILPLAYEAWRLAGVFGGAVVLTLLLYYANATAFSLTLTENAGLAFGAVGLALLLRGAQSPYRAVSLVGIALVSIAVNSRAGPMFVLPMLVVWAGLWAYTKKQSIAGAMLGAVAAVSVGFAAEFALIAANGGPLNQAHSNFSYVLYGLSVGGKGWTQIYSDHPEIQTLVEHEAARKIYAFAFDNILHQPGLFLGTLFGNLAIYFRQGLDLGFESFELLRAMTLPLWLLGVFAIALRLRDARYQLIGLMALGNLLSAPFVFLDGGVRLFAATASVDAVLVGIGAGLIARTTAALIFMGYPPSVARADDEPSQPRLAFSLAAVLLILVVLPYTPLRRLAAVTPLDAPPCPNGETIVSVRLGMGTPVFAVSESDDSTQVHPLRIAAKTFRHGLDPYFHHRKDFLKEPPFSFLLAYQQQRGASNANSIAYFFSPTDLTVLYGRSVRICYDAAAIDLTNGLGLYSAKSVTVIDDDSAAAGRSQRLDAPERDKNHAQ